MKKIYYLLLLLSLGFNSCDDPEDIENKKKISDKSFDIEFTEILNTNSRFQYKFDKMTTFLIKSKTEENELFSNHLFDVTMPPTVPLPNVDYNTKMVICIAYPVQSSGSNKFKVTSVKMNEGIIEVSSELFIPGIGTDDIGFPVVFIEIDKYDNEVKFLETIIKRETTQNDDLLGKEWKLKYVKNPNGSITDPDNYNEADSHGQTIVLNTPTINFDLKENVVFGGSNCNAWSANYGLDVDKIKIDDLNTTLADCAFTSKYQLLILNSKKINYTTDSLYIESEINNEKYTLVFFYVKKQIENNLENTEWRLESYSIDDGITLINSYIDENKKEVNFAEEEYSLEFRKDLVKIFANCTENPTVFNLFENNRILFNTIKVELICGFNQEYYQMLFQTENYEIVYGGIDRLKLYNKSKETLMIFQMKY